MKFFYPKFLVLFCLFLSVNTTKASHLLGGCLAYEYVGGSTYRITLTVYGDCNDPTTFDGANGSAQLFASVGVFESVTGTIIDTLQLFNPVITNYDFSSDSNCQLNFCIAKGIYIDTLTLPSASMAYTITYQRCCINSGIINISNSANEGFTLSATIPPNNSFYNTSPLLSIFPQYFFVNQPFTYNFLPYDNEGDSLEFNLCAPLGGADISNPAPVPPSAPPYNNLQWASPYSNNNMIGGTPITIDSLTGIISGTPNTIGRFAVGICIKEFRNHQLIDTTVIPLTVIITDCIPLDVNVPIKTDFRITPNPATDQLTITTENEAPVDVYIYDMLGNCVLTHKNFSTNLVDLNAPLIPSGYYIFKLTDQHGLSSSKGFIIAR